MVETLEAAFKEKIQHYIHQAVNEFAMVMVIDGQGTIQYVNEKFTEVTDFDGKGMIGDRFTTYFSRDLSNALTQAMKSKEQWAGECKQTKRNGTYYWAETTLTPIIQESTEEHHFVLFQQETTERKRQEQRIERLAYIDPLTNLPNRNQIDKWITEIDHTPEKEINVLFIDIDHFKTINDNFGHDTGDRVLITIAERLRDCMEEAFIFRYDGEEFIVLLEDLSIEEIHERLNEILQVIREPMIIDELELLVTASIGISTGTPFTCEEGVLPAIENLIKKADTAMYYAKKLGRNQFHFNTVGQTRELERNYQIELEVREALERSEFSLVYQPLINLKTNKIVGVESLLRWDNRLLGKVSPAEFIPTLEETGLIIPIGKWILKTVCNQMKSWQEQGLFLQRVSVNVSPLQFRDPNFVADLKGILHEEELDASYLELEITEGTLLDIEDSAQKLHDLQELGVKVSIDDFGTGYSSLSYLKQLPIDTLKIDKSFIDDLDRDGKIIVNTIISMGKNLQFRIIAEGIENSDQFKYLQQQQCHEGQGYFFSRPVESDKIEELYHSLQ